MKTSAPLANLVTLGARDFVSLRDFYRNLAWQQIIDNSQFATFDLLRIVLACFPSTSSPTTEMPNPSPAFLGGPIRFGAARRIRSILSSVSNVCTRRWVGRKSGALGAAGAAASDRSQ
jgi:hypothetical protein